MAAQVTEADYLAGLENAGFAGQLINSDPELKSLMAKAIRQQWTPQRFQVELKQSKWWSGRSEAQRRYDARVKTDPKSVEAERQAMISQLWDQSFEMGVPASADRLGKIATSALRLGLNESQVRDLLAAEWKYDPQKVKGSAAEAERSIKAMNAAYGVKMTPEVTGWWIGQILNGNQNMAGFETTVRNQAKSRYAWLADDIDAGRTVREIADPYFQMASETLEIAPDALDLNDQVIQMGLSGSKDGKMQTRELWEYQNMLRDDPRWMRTNNAREQMMGAANGILKTWGLVI